jgi:hypothetical protein
MDFGCEKADAGGECLIVSLQRADLVCDEGVDVVLVDDESGDDSLDLREPLMLASDVIHQAGELVPEAGDGRLELG